MHEWLYTLTSVLAISIVSLVGLFTLSLKETRLKQALIYLVSLSAGALFGDAFIHLLPEATEAGFTLQVSLYVLAGVFTFFVIEKILHWHHYHLPEKGRHTLAFMNLIGDGVHNFIDGMIIAASYLASIPAGIATTLAVVLHEIPQEIGDFGVLLHAGLSRYKALVANFATALMAVLGALVTLAMAAYTESLTLFLVPFAAGGFIYIAGSDLIPELHKEPEALKSALQLLSIVAGVAFMLLLTLVEA